MDVCLQQVLDARRMENAHRDDASRAVNDIDFQREHDAASKCKHRPIHMNNKGGADFNILTFAYDQSAGGQQLHAEVRR